MSERTNFFRQNFYITQFIKLLFSKEIMQLKRLIKQADCHLYLVVKNLSSTGRKRVTA